MSNPFTIRADVNTEVARSEIRKNIRAMPESIRIPDADVETAVDLAVHAAESVLKTIADQSDRAGGVLVSGEAKVAVQMMMTWAAVRALKDFLVAVAADARRGLMEELGMTETQLEALRKELGL